LLLTAAAGCGGDALPPPHGPNVLLIVIDTLRADRLAAATMPAVDRFGQGAIRFTHADSPRAKTTPAVASLLTGLYPHDHGARDLSTRLPADVPTLAEAFSRAGWTTAAIVGNFVLSDELTGLSRGFGTWVDDLPDRSGVPPDNVPQRRARSLTDGALVALGLAPPPEPAAAPEPAPGAAPGSPPAVAGPTAKLIESGRPWFLYLHYMDPHGAYDPPAEHRLFGGGAPDYIPSPESLPPDSLHAFRLAQHNLAPECETATAAATPDDPPQGSIDAACVRALYDGETHYVDAEIGRLLDAAAAAGLLANTIVVITADHGESLGEHRYWFEHGFYCYETTNRVPLLLRAPGLASSTYEGDVSLVDLAPTLLDLAGLPPLPERPARADAAPDPLSPRGASLAAWLSGGKRLADHSVFGEKLEGADLANTIQMKAVRLGDWKYIRRYAHRTADTGGARELVVIADELYDLAADPGETVNLADAPPAAAPLARLKAELLRFAAADVHFADIGRQLAAEQERLQSEDPQAFEILRAMGYVK
jgi:choline-sulfatase